MSVMRYPGGKARLQKFILENLLEKYERSEWQYREPFFGGGGIGLTFLNDYSPEKGVWINDRDPGIAALWTAVIRYPVELQDRVLRFNPSAAAFYAFRDELKAPDGVSTDPNAIVDIGFKKLAIHRISFSGLGTMAGGPLGGKKQKTAQKIDARWSPKRICHEIETIHARLAALDVHENGCTCLDFGALIEDESCPALLYLDPPYVGVGNALYQYGFSQVDHVRLAEMLRKTPHSWVLSYDDCPLIHDLYSWAHIEEISVGYSLSSVRRTSELLISRNASEITLPIPKCPRRTAFSAALAS